MKKATDNFKDIVKGNAKKVLTTIAASAANASAVYSAQLAESNIRAQADLAQYQRQAMREKPVVQLNSAQIDWLVNQSCCGFPQGNSNIVLDSNQADYVFRHMLGQYSLDAKSKTELVETVALLVGVPLLLKPLYKAHAIIGKHLLVPYINRKLPEESKISYADTVNPPLYEGIQNKVILRYNLHYSDKCKSFCNEYKKSRQHVVEIHDELKKIGVKISDIKHDGIYLLIYLTWTA